MKRKAIFILSLVFLPVSCEMHTEPSSPMPNSLGSSFSDAFTPFPEDFGWDGLTEYLDEQKDFVLILSRPTCPYCQDTVPLVQNWIEQEKEKKDSDPSYFTLDIEFLNTSLNAEHIDQLYDLVKPGMAENDKAVVEGSLYVPNLSVFKEGRLVFSETGLPQTEQAVAEKFEAIKTILQSGSLEI